MRQKIVKMFLDLHQERNTYSMAHGLHLSTKCHSNINVLKRSCSQTIKQMEQVKKKKNNKTLLSSTSPVGNFILKAHNYRTKTLQRSRMCKSSTSTVYVPCVCAFRKWFPYQQTSGFGDKRMLRKLDIFYPIFNVNLWIYNSQPNSIVFFFKSEMYWRKSRKLEWKDKILLLGWNCEVHFSCI